MIRAGSLDRTIVVQRATTTINDFGEKAQVWAPLITMRAARIVNETIDRTDGGVSTTARTMTLRTRFVDVISLDDRVSYGGEPWIIRDIQEIGRRKALEIKVERFG